MILNTSVLFLRLHIALDFITPFTEQFFLQFNNFIVQLTKSIAIINALNYIKISYTAVSVGKVPSITLLKLHPASLKSCTACMLNTLVASYNVHCSSIVLITSSRNIMVIATIVSSVLNSNYVPSIRKYSLPESCIASISI